MSSDSNQHPTSSYSPPQPPQTELRHVTSVSFRSPRRASRMLRTSDARLGSRSPGSIPSSPTSVRSSSSAIFERDIEPVVPPSPPTSNPHRIPRAKTTEHIDHTVPSVLDSAAEILAKLQDPEAGDQIAVVTPAASSSGDHAGRSSGFASPIGSFRSRSPSPLGLRFGSGTIGAGQRTDLLLSIPQANQHPQAMSAIATPPLSSSPQSNASSSGVPPYPTIHTNFGQDHHLVIAATPSIITPTSAYFTTASTVDGESSPTATSHDDHHESHSKVPNSAAVAVAVVSSPLNAFSPSSTFSGASSISHPPSPTHAATKRLSFMSYSDLLTSTPASTFPLSMLTTSASFVDPPPHLPTVCGLPHMYPNPTTPSATGSVRGFAMNANSRQGGKRDSLFDDIGGEWEREGLGKGLEERLDELLPATSPVGQKA